ncbi:hypothetical protein I0C86_11035 [Plantactinospora sp. S1510]|uniref:Uncharacterized protein n=1 Tax=Plantactinospora alkalitolerans TaxID=2789879 RepID=A0ABS0GTI3_9ACTN|nr:hypothetical protein [Plantactinospora alkalitolerans]MBF9129497.1 hypothetical protein [Plantactinospora alkalitolerans]
MPDSPYPNPPDPTDASFTRRVLLRIGGVLGLTAAGTAAVGAAASANDTSAPAVPDAPGDFGAPPAPGIARRQAGRARTGSITNVRPGQATGPESATASGARLVPNHNRVIDTPLSRRQAPWTVEG